VGAGSERVDLGIAHDADDVDGRAAGRHLDDRRLRVGVALREAELAPDGVPAAEDVVYERLVHENRPGLGPEVGGCERLARDDGRAHEIEIRPVDEQDARAPADRRTRAGAHERDGRTNVVHRRDRPSRRARRSSGRSSSKPRGSSSRR
jgi:hypothetical protein